MRALIHIERLKRLSDHLASGRFVQDYSETTVIMCMNNLYFHNGRKFVLPPFLIEELDYLFPENFERNAMGYIIPLYNRNTSAEFVFPWFFGLDTMSYEHLFRPGKQHCNLYHGEVLDALAPPEKWASNIYRFIETVSQDVYIENIAKRIVIVEKIRKDHPDRIFKEFEKP